MTSVPNEAVIIKGNFNQMTQAICNILQNSVDAIIQKFSDSPRYDGQIRMELISSDQNIELIISDNGSGIKAEHESLLFNPLFTTKNPDHNSGLGLTVAFQIVNEHGGSIDINSHTAEGTQCIVSLPLWQAHPQG